MQWVGERFFSTGGAWIDAATGRAVRLRVVEASGVNELEWSDRCARLATVRHPLLNVLLDYGVACAGRLFEAYEPGAPVTAPGPLAETALAHLVAFLRALDLPLDASHCRCTMRPVAAGRARWMRPIGSLLQPRDELRFLEEALDTGAPAGPAVLNVAGASGSGLRTALLAVARAARLRGFVPLHPEVPVRFPATTARLRERHVCLLDTAAGIEAPARITPLICEFATASARRHVVVRFHRAAPSHGSGIAFAGMPVSSLVEMVRADPSFASCEEEVRAIAARADGLPGRFLALLSGGGPAKGGTMMVHESPAQYVVDLPASSAALPVGGRVLGSALRAVPRAVLLARSGRHTAAARALDRGRRVLEGRGRRDAAAACALQLGWLALDRGRTAEAKRCFVRARDLAPAARGGVLATIGEGVALVDEARLVEAEAVLRGALAAAEALDDPEAATAAAAGVARSLYWQARHAEGVAVAAPWKGRAPGTAAHVRLLAILARCQAALGRTAQAIAAAREANAAAPRLDDPRAAATAELALAEALAAAGDRPAARAAASRAARIARSAHLPLFRLRAAAVADDRHGGVLERMRRLGRAPALPALFARRLETHRAAAEPVTELESLLAICQQSADEATALAGICRRIAERLGAASVGVVSHDERTLVCAGRAFGTLPSVVRETLACGSRVLPDGRQEPKEAAEPVRYGGEVIAALACRWTAGTAVDVDGACMTLRAAALSLAAPVRAMLDTAPACPPSAWGDLLGDSAAAVRLREAVARAARAPFPVLIEGESGSGKELVARAIHRLGPRRERKCCAINCAALTDDLLEAELFGHARGAFTGAATERAGLFEEADGGTIFLDEVAELSARAQAKLLRVLQEGEVRRVGENFARRVDVRVVAATNRSLEAEVRAGRFRADLRFRLDVVRLVVPPLRERVGDIPLLAAHFWREAAHRVGSRATLSAEALAALSRYDWPGNVRELQNVIAWIAVHSPNRGRIGPSALPRHVAQSATALACTLEAAREEFERRFIRAALASANGRRSRAADTLGITRQGLAKMMRRLRIEAP
ncbi:MAG TPA: sigma 54-interacting transcriptional regulator [Vicinamibacterales bacterium]|nr:sigma 54-interacting transcriptional regulator [Vicinamibacterales bacterium]